MRRGGKKGSPERPVTSGQRGARKVVSVARSQSERRSTHAGRRRRRSGSRGMY